jgi:hypothetical protein
MKYVLDCTQERALSLVLERDFTVLEITIVDGDFSKSIYLGEQEIFELIGALHHLQKQINSVK